MKTGDVVLVPFPFAELTQAKARPAAVIAETADRWRDIVVVAISSVIPYECSPNEFTLDPSPRNGLRVRSIVKVDRVLTVKTEKVIAHLGELSASDREQLVEIFQKLPKNIH